MTAVIYELDTMVTVYERTDRATAIGYRSKYETEPHPNTGNTIQGFQWDYTKWPTGHEDDSVFVAPSLWDPSRLGLQSLHQSGVGDQLDLFVSTTDLQHIDGKAQWKPEVNHGYYYIEDDEYYLYSDSALTAYPTYSGLVESGGNYVQLEYECKPGVPVLARGWVWNSSEGDYRVDRKFYKVVDFTGLYEDEGNLVTRVGDEFFWDNVNTSEREFTFVYSGETPVVYFNQQVSEQVGEFFVDDPVSGLSYLTTSNLKQLEEVGIHDGTDDLELRLQYSPVDPEMQVQIITDFAGSTISGFDVVDSLTEGTVGQVVIDRDLGIIKFGTATKGGIPVAGSNIRAAYYKTLSLEYEPDNTTDTVKFSKADLNPIRRYKGEGFVHLKRDPTDIGSITLSAILPEISEDYFGPLYLGNNFCRVQADVLSTKGEPIEGIEVGFEIVSGTGLFGTDLSASAYTNAAGEAQTLFNAPRTIDELGDASTAVTTVSGESSLTVSGYQPSSLTDSLYLFQVAREDDILGIPFDELLSHYEDYLTSGEFTGPSFQWSLGDATNYGWIGGSYASLVRWEIVHRLANNLLVPTTYEPGDLVTGKKTVIAVWDSDAVNPHTGSAGAYMPLQPESFTYDSNGTVLQFDTELPEITASGLVKSYFVVGPAKAEIRAWAINSRTGQIITSNTIEILIDINTSAKGLYEIDAINSVPSGLLTNPEYWDTLEFELDEVEVTATGLVPLGWKIRSSGITLASALDGVTFLDINEATSLIATHSISHSFEVTVA